MYMITYIPTRIKRELRARRGFRDYIMGSYYGIILQKYMTTHAPTSQEACAGTASMEYPFTCSFFLSTAYMAHGLICVLFVCFQTDYICCSGKDHYNLLL